MKNLNEYIDEKLKLSDISKMKSPSQWVDANRLKFADLKEGYIVELRNKRRYMVIPRSFLTLKSKPGIKYILISQQGTTNHLEDYVNQFPKVNSGYSVEWDIVRVYTRNRHYANKSEIDEDIKKLYQF